MRVFKTLVLRSNRSCVPAPISQYECLAPNSPDSMNESDFFPFSINEKTYLLHISENLVTFPRIAELASWKEVNVAVILTVCIGHDMIPANDDLSFFTLVHNGGPKSSLAIRTGIVEFFE